MELEDMVMMDPKELRTREPFVSALAIPQAIEDAIVASMKKGGYDVSQPIHVWRRENVVIDGHTRKGAAIKAGLSLVAVYFHDFVSEDDAFDYAIRCQRDRRNLSEAQLLKLVSLVDQRKNFGAQVSGTVAGPSAQQTAKKIGTNQVKVIHARAVLSDAEETAEVMAGRKTIKQAAKAVIRKGGGPRKGRQDQIEARRNRVKTYFEKNPGVSIKIASIQLDIPRNMLRHDLVSLGLKPPSPSDLPKLKSKPKPCSNPANSPASKKPSHGPTWKRLQEEFSSCEKALHDQGDMQYISRNWPRMDIERAIRFTDVAISRFQELRSQLTTNLDALMTNNTEEATNVSA